MMNNRSVENVSKVINDFLNSHNLSLRQPCWCLGESSVGGIGVFASRDITCGEELFVDLPIIIGPRPKSTFFCIVCYELNKLNMCSYKCGLPICSEKCDKAHEKLCDLIRNKSTKEATSLDLGLFKHVTPLYSSLLPPEKKLVVSCLKSHRVSHHGFEVDKLLEMGMTFDPEEEEFLRFVCCVMDANAFEVSIVKDNDRLNIKGLYPLASLLNHSCIPNVMQTFDKNQRMITRATCDILKGSELTHSYVRLFWSTLSRQFHLVKTKHFICRCSRCSDSTEFGAYMSAFRCRVCKGNAISKNPLILKSDWICEDCKTEVKRFEIANLWSTLGSILRSFSGENLDVMLKFLNGRLAYLVPPNNEVAVDLKYRIVWIIGHHEKHKWQDIDDSLILVKKGICEELLALLLKLRLGECTLKGLLLYELYLCLKESDRRLSMSETNGSKSKKREMSEILEQAVHILKDDAPSTDSS